VLIQWSRIVRLVRAFNTAANALLERSDRLLAVDVLREWQQLGKKQKMADEHGRSAGLRRSFQAATAAMSQMEAQDFQSFLPTMAPGVYGRTTEDDIEAEERVWRVILTSVCDLCASTAHIFIMHMQSRHADRPNFDILCVVVQKKKQRIRLLKLSVMLCWRQEAVASRRFERFCQRRARRLRISIVVDWIEQVQKLKMLKRSCLNIMVRTDGALIKTMFLEVNTNMPLTAGCRIYARSLC